MSPTDRALRLACQAVVVLWIAAFLGWRELSPREVRVPVKTTSIEARELPPAPAPEEAAKAEPEEVAKAAPEEAAKPASEEEAEPEPEEAAKPEATAAAEAEPPPARPEPPPAPPEPEVARAEPEPAPSPEAEPPPAAAPEPQDAPLEATPIAAPTLPEPRAVAEATPPRAPEPRPRAEAPRAAPPALEPAPAPEPTPEPASRAPVAEPAPAATRETAAVAETAPAEAPALPVLAVDESDVARGGALLTGEAGFPALESRYEGYGSFRDYARAMQRLGARFVVVDRRRIVGTIDPWTLERGELGDPAGLSPRARDYAGEPELLRAGRLVRREHGARAEVMMLVPRRIDAGLFGGIARALEARGREPESYRQIRAHYERGPRGSLRLRVETAVRRDGREDPLPLLFDLDGLAGRSRA